jgi:hypothetical protein
LLRLKPQTGSQVRVSWDEKSYFEVSCMEKKTVQRRLKREEILIVADVWEEPSASLVK